MRGMRYLMLAFLLVGWTLVPSVVCAQYEPEQEQENVTPPDSTQPETPDVAPAPPMENVLEQANTWLRRLLFRGELDASHIGAYAQYQVTAWREGIGSYGPVLAQMTVYCLGPTEWLGEEAEWLQAIYRTMDSEPTVVEYDLTVPAVAKVEKVFRLLYRIDHGGTHSTSLALPEGQVDYDIADRTIPIGEEEIRLYSGTYQTRMHRGSGFNGAQVVIYKADDLPPLEIVVLGYGEQGLTYIGGGSDGTPLFSVPPPPHR